VARRGFQKRPCNRPRKFRDLCCRRGPIEPFRNRAFSVHHPRPIRRREEGRPGYPVMPPHRARQHLGHARHGGEPALVVVRTLGVFVRSGERDRHGVVHPRRDMALQDASAGTVSPHSGDRSAVLAIVMSLCIPHPVAISLCSRHASERGSRILAILAQWSRSHCFAHPLPIDDMALSKVTAGATPRVLAFQVHPRPICGFAAPLVSRRRS